MSTLWSSRTLLASAATLAFMASLPLWGDDPAIGVGARSPIGGRLILRGPPLDIIYWLFLAMATGAVVLLAVIRYSRFGSGLRAIREDEVAAETIGIPTVKYKVLAFAISAIIPGL